VSDRDEGVPVWTPLSETAVAALSDALIANGCMLEALVGQVDYIDSDGRRCWSFIAVPGQYSEQSVQMAAHLNAFYQERQRMELRQFIRNQNRP
jgi:hypothetical protein